MKPVIVVAMHKPYAAPADGAYLPVHAGAAGKERFGAQSDAQGESISQKNDVYCELTALYWAWKNTASDALGLMHYRRYLALPGRRGRGLDRALTGGELSALLRDAPVLLPKKRHYVIETRESHYLHAHGAASLAALRRAMQSRCPQYLPAFDRDMKRRSGHCFNLFVMRRPLADAYCAWLFDLLFAAEADMRQSCPQEITPRLFGYLAERMLDCWLDVNGVPFRELPVVHLEGERWGRKIFAFLARKLRG